jgi:hypothetical protein
MGSWQGNPRNPTSTATIREEMSCRIDERYEHSIGPSAEITTLGCQRSSVRTSGHKGMVKGIKFENAEAHFVEAGPTCCPTIIPICSGPVGRAWRYWLGRAGRWLGRRAGWFVASR